MVHFSKVEKCGGASHLLSFFAPGSNNAAPYNDANNDDNNMNINGSSSQQQQEGRRLSSGSNNSSESNDHRHDNRRRRSSSSSLSLDLDKTLPLPPNSNVHAEIQMMESSSHSQSRRHSVNNDDNCSVNNNRNNHENLLGKKLQEWTFAMKIMSNTTKSNNNNNINNNNEESSNDASNNNNNNIDAAAAPTESACPKIITINENDVADILSFTSNLLHHNYTNSTNNCQQNSSSNNNNNEWKNGENYKMMIMIVQLVMMALDKADDSDNVAAVDNTIDNNNNNNGGGGQLIESSSLSSTSSSNSSVVGGASVTMEEQYARRILTDGILPFASFSSTATCSSLSNDDDDDVNVSTPEGGVGAAVNNGERKEDNGAAVWNAKFVQAVVIQHLLPSICTNTNSNNNNSGRTRRKNNNTMAVDILLDSFLARMDADECSQILMNISKLDESNSINGGSLQEGGEDDDAAFYSSRIHNVDDILDILCDVTPPTTALSSSSNNTSQIRVRPNATTAIINSLRDLESNLPGRLSRCRVWRREKTCSTSTTSSSSSSYYYKFIDRPTNLIQMTTSTLVQFKQCHDFDSMPPLIYQLGLLPLSVMRHSTTTNNSSGSGNKGERNGGGGGGACVKSNEEKKLESEKQRGIRLRRMCLDGIVMVLDDDNDGDGKSGGSSATGSSGGNSSNVEEEGNTPTNDVFGLQSSSKDLFGARDMDIGQGVNSQQQQYLQEAWTWARYNSISFIGTCSVSDPEMCKAVLSMLGGEITHSNGSGTSGGEVEVAPFRYQRLTPIKVAMGLSVSKAVPRMRTQVLEMIRTLVMEEEMIRIKCGRGVTGNVMGLGQPWMDCLVKSVQMKRHCSSKKHHSNNSGVGHVLLNIISVAKFALDTESGGRGGLDLLQSLISLGFLLVDCVKRDEPKSSSTNAVPSSRILSSVMEIASFSDSSSTKVSTVDTSAAHATASTGRFILCCLFYQSAASASHYLSSSLTTSHGASSSEGGTSLCRTVLKTSFDKFCAMAPNSVEHSLLLTDLLNFSPKLFRHVFMDTAGGAHDELMDRQREEIIGLSLATSHLRDIIETLSNLIGGGMSSQVACDVISPAVGRILLVQATQRQGLGSLWKKTDIEDHIDHAFLLAKKALFSADVEKRKAAANLLVALLGAASVASSMGRASTWTSVIYEIKGCLRRCLTQHQPSVRMEAYSAMMALLPKTAVSASSASQTQDSVSPASSASPASAVSPLAPRSQAGGISRMIIPPICQNSLIRAVMEVLLSSLDRYVTTPQEELHEKDARLKRAAQGVGLSQMEVEDEDGKGASNDKSMPLRFENIISKVPQRNMGQAKKGKSKASVPIGQMLFNEALSRINEPLSFLVASCFAAASLSTDNDNQNELKKALTQLRRRLAACSDIDEYLVWLSSNKQIFDIKDNSKRIEEMAIFKISTLVCVALLAEAMLSTCEWDKGDLVESDGDVELANQEVEDLFNLRIDAIDKAAEIMSSFVSQTKKSKKLKKIDGNSQEEPKKGRKTAKKAKKDNGGATYTTVKTSEINAATLVRNKKLVEEAIHDLSPAMSKDFLAHSLRQFGTSASKKGEVDSIFDGEESTDVATRLYGCLAFRRFLLTKCMLLTSGSSMVVTPGVRFCSLDEPGLDEKLVQVRLASCFLFGPLLFSDFCSQCYHLDRTSASPNHSSKSDLSLAQLSLRAFNFCVRGMNFHAPNHPLSRAKRVGALLSMSMRMASKVAPQSKDGWDFYLALKNDSVKIKDVDVPIDELELMKSLLPFLSFRSKFTHSDDEAPVRLCLFSELIRNGLHAEALECCQLISAAASAFNEPNMREQLSCAFLRAYEPLKVPTNEILGIDFEDVEKEEVPPLSAVVAVAFQLNHQLDGETHVPLGSPKNLRVARSAMGLPLTMIGNWPDRHQARLQRELNRSEGGSIIGVVQQLVSALHGTLGCGDNFIEVEDKSGPTKKEVKLSCVKMLLETTDDSSKEKLAIGNMISSSIEAGLDNADFVALKMIPHMNVASLSLTQRYVSSSLFSVSKVISTSAPFAENLDCGATFSSSLLKSTKRLYSILVKLILSYMNNPESLVSTETKLLLDYVTSTFMPKISALLLDLSKQTTTKNGKYIAESKIESHGKIAALLVFEKEKLDNALLKVGAKLKSLGLEDESTWLEEQVVAVHSRDFEINTDEVENAMAMEAPKERKKKAAGAGSKRKVKSEPSKKDKKKKKQKAEELEEEDDEDEEMNDSDAVAEVVGESDEEDDSNEESEDEEEDSDEDDGISLGNLTANMGSESEEEAEFD